MKDNNIVKQWMWTGLALAYLCTFTYGTVLRVDPTESSIYFKVKNLGFLSVEGQFEGFSVVFGLQDNKVIQSVEANIDVNSLNTKNRMRDRDIKSKKYLNLRKYPYITFKSTKPLSITDKNLTGELQINGVTKTVTMPVEFSYLKHKKTNKYVLSAKSTYILNRYDFEVDRFPFLIDESVQIDLVIIAKAY